MVSSPILWPSLHILGVDRAALGIEGCGENQRVADVAAILGCNRQASVVNLDGEGRGRFTQGANRSKRFPNLLPDIFSLRRAKAANSFNT